MKKSIIVIVALACSTAAYAQSTWTNKLIQRQGSPAVELWVDNVPQTGSQLSILPLVEGGATFEIWTLESGVGKSPIKLATQIVDSYQLSSTVTITAGDSYTTGQGIVIPRTRVDQPFRVNVTVAGLRSEATAEDGAKKVSFTHEVTTYPAGVYVAPVNPVKTQLTSSFIQQNGASSVSFLTSNLIAPDLSKASGREYFTVSSLAGLGVSAGTLASAFIEVWPMAGVTLNGITNGATYKSVPALTMALVDLYPGSSTWVQVYSGPPVLNKQGTLVPDSTVLNTNNIVSSQQVVINSIPVTNPGQYTVEVLHQTPFGTERLGYRTFTYDTTIRVNGQIFSSE